MASSRSTGARSLTKEKILSHFYLSKGVHQWQREIHLLLLGVTFGCTFPYIHFRNPLGIALSCFSLLIGLWAHYEQKKMTYLFNALVQLMFGILILMAVQTANPDLSSFRGTSVRRFIGNTSCVMFAILAVFNVMLAVYDHHNPKHMSLSRYQKQTQSKIADFDRKYVPDEPIVIPVYPSEQEGGSEYKNNNKNTARKSQNHSEYDDEENGYQYQNRKNAKLNDVFSVNPHAAEMHSTIRSIPASNDAPSPLMRETKFVKPEQTTAVKTNPFPVATSTASSSSVASKTKDSLNNALTGSDNVTVIIDNLMDVPSLRETVKIDDHLFDDKKSAELTKNEDEAKIIANPFNPFDTPAADVPPAAAPLRT